MNKFIKSTLAMALSVSAMGAMAETYSVEVTLNSQIGETPLVATEEVAMSYPELTVTDATVEGARCVANGHANLVGFNNAAATEANSLCPGATGNFATVKFTGAKNAMITVFRELPVQEQAGMRFGNLGGAYSDTTTVTLSGTDGTADVHLGSSIDLFDKSQVTDSVLVFNYEITGAYQ